MVTNMSMLAKPEIAQPKFEDNQPFHWEIEPIDDGIKATNNISGESFEGSMAEFNLRMRK